MNHQHHGPSQVNLATKATIHCLAGCGLGEIVGVIIGTALGIPYFTRIGTGLVLGFVFGFMFGMLPLVQTGMTFRHAAKIVMTTEVFSILSMEAAEATIEIFFPGMRKAGFIHLRYWLGLSTALIAGFIVAFPVNLFLVKRGVRHQH